MLAAETDAAALQRGQALFIRKCSICHLQTGTGIPPIYPPLAGSDYLRPNRIQGIHLFNNGLGEKIAVNGAVYNNIMPAQSLNDAAATKC